MSNGVNSHNAQDDHALLHDRLEARFAETYAKQVAQLEEKMRADIEAPLLAKIAQLEEQVKSLNALTVRQDIAAVRASIGLIHSFGFSAAEAEELYKST